MSINQNMFARAAASLDVKRSVFPRDSQHKTSFDLGRLIPIYIDEVLPGDTVSMDVANVIRTSTAPIAPIMDNMYADIYFFFVPTRLVWEHWEQFNGANDTGAWTQTGSYSIPMRAITVPTITSGDTLQEYFGLPSPTNSVNVSELPLRAYWKIANDWFIDENNIGPRVYTIGDLANSGAGSITYDERPMKVAKFHDYFTSCLPAPQKGGSVALPLGKFAPLKTYQDLGYDKDDVHALTEPFLGYAGQDSSSVRFLGSKASSGAGVSGKMYVDTTSSFGSGTGVVNRTNLVADLSAATAATINQIRYAFQLQKLLEKDARGGTRYIEMIRAHFGVQSSDARLQRAEYLAGHRFRINVDQVLSTTETLNSSNQTVNPVGNPGAHSVTGGKASFFTKSFEEHGYLIGVCCVRQDLTYGQGLEKLWTRSERFDFYYPVLANIGEQPVYKKELYCDGSSSDSAVFGYQEAWAEYRFKPSKVTGLMNPAKANSFNFWTLAEVFASAPSLGASFIEQSNANLNRALAGGSSLPNFIADFYFKTKWSRVMPLYSIPGLIDHH